MKGLMKGLSLRNIQPTVLLAFLLLLLLPLLPLAWSSISPPSPQANPIATLEPIPNPTATSLPATPRPSPTPAPPVILCWSFQPVDDPTPTPLHPASYPGPGDPESPDRSSNTTPTTLHSPLFIYLDRPVSVQQVQDNLSISPAVTGHLDQLDKHTFTFTPQPGWQANTAYSVHVAAFEGQVSFAFRTGPFATAHLPSADPSGRDLTATIRLNFSYLVDCASIEAALQIEPATPYRIKWLDRTFPPDSEEDGHVRGEGRSLQIVPREAWSLDTTYRITLGAEAVDIAGSVLGEPQQWTFATRSSVLSFAPQRAAYWFDPIVIVFDRPVDRSSVEEALQVTPAISGTFQWQEGRMRFLPTLGWEGSTTYQVHLAPSARAADGTSLLNHPLQWSFSIPAVNISVSFGYGPNLQVLDAAGPRLIQFSQWSSAPGVYGTLYQVSPEWVLSTYSSSFKGKVTISTEGLTRVRQWRDAAPDNEIALPADVPPGLYVLAIGGPESEQDALIVILTHYSIVIKEASVGVGSSAWHQVAGQATAITSGTPRPDMTVYLYDRSGRLADETTTDSAGRFETAVVGDTEPLLALGQVEGEWTLCGFSLEWRAQGGWWDWRGWQTNPPTGRWFRTYVYTDRPIYRPGQTVYVKAIVRADDDAIYSLPPVGTPVTVRLRDARDNVLSTQVLSTNEFGTVHTSFTLAEGGTLGGYNVEVVVEEEVTRQPLKVEEYRKPDYEVTVYTDRGQYLQGDTITVTVEARYYFGQPLTDGPISLQLYRREYSYWENEDRWYAVRGQQYSGFTDDQGRWQVRLPAPTVYGYGWASERTDTISLEATVEDGSGQSVSSHAVVQVHKYRHGTTLFLSRYAYRPGEDIPVDLLVRDYLGEPIPDAPLHVRLCRWDRGEYNEVVVEAHTTTDEAGQAHTSLHVNEQGWFRLHVSGSGEDEAWIWVYDPSSAALWSGSTSELQISADKPAYAIGEVAQLLVRSPVTGTALLTLERGRVRRMLPVELTSKVTTIPLPVDADFAPNVFATIQIYRPTTTETWGSWSSRPDATILIASTELVVPVSERRLQVRITPEREEYAIREEAVITLYVSDVAGRPVQAELSLAMVDEAIYALSQDLALDPFEAFYQRRQNLIRTYHSLEPTRFMGGAEMGSGSGDMDPSNPRRNFPDTAYWNPTIVTDENGYATVVIPLPDSLTRWRLLARAVTGDTLVGEGTATLTVTQSLVVRPAVPRFLVQGDVFTLTATLHNYSDAATSVEAGLWAQGMDIHSPVSFTVGIGFGETVRAHWQLQANVLGDATLVTYASGPNLGDAVQYDIPVIPFAVPQVTSASGEVVGERVERFHLPDDFIPEVTQLEIRLAPSVVSTLLDGLEYLIDYPFG